MQTITSRDGTPIAYERIGDGPPVVLVGGAFGHRSRRELVDLAWRLAGRFAVFTYDRRGRGASGDGRPYAVERELEDLDALVDAAGGSAFVWGSSTGGVLALRAAARGAGIERLAIHEPPFAPDRSGEPPPADLRPRLQTLLDAGRLEEFFLAGERPCAAAASPSYGRA